MSHAREHVAHGAAVPRAFLTTRLPVFVSRVQEISAEKKKTEEAKRRSEASERASERKKETGFLIAN